MGALRMRLRSPKDEFIDRWLGIRTIGWRPAVGLEGDPNLRVDYLPTSYSTLRRVLKRINLRAEDTFVDFGAGLGRAVFTARWLGAGRAIGVEIDSGLVEGARANLYRSRLPKTGIEFLETGADAFHDHGYTAIYMYHPFGPATMQKVISNIAESLRENPRPLRIAYLNPVHADVLDRCVELERFDELGNVTVESKSGGNSSHAIFWRSAI